MTNVASQGQNDGPLWAVRSGRPSVHPDGWVAPTATVIGRVKIGAGTGIWYGAVLRAEFEDIVVGDGSNVQDGVAAHVDSGFPLRVGRNVSVGHNAVLHGCTIGDGTLVGMGAIIMNGAVIGDESLIAAGALVLEGTVVPPRSVVAGVPAKVRREVTQEEIDHNALNAATYRELLNLHRGAELCGNDG